MANKFQKSVMERMQHDADRQKEINKRETLEKTKPDNVFPSKSLSTKEGSVNKKEIQPPESLPSESTNDLPKQQQTTQTQAEVLRIDKYLRRDHPRVAENKTFYLDSDIINAVKVTARSRGVTDSKLVNDILRGVLDLS